VTDRPLQSLDFLYTPSRDVAADVAYLTEVLAGRVVFAIESMGTRVAAVELTASPPLVILADHVEGEHGEPDEQGEQRGQCGGVDQEGQEPGDRSGVVLLVLNSATRFQPS
jgi:hypothetical protein